jgi:hypothetical protein
MCFLRKVDKMKAWQLLDSKEKWCQGVSTNEKGQRCMMSAVEKVYGFMYGEKRGDLMDYLGQWPTSWNDAPHRTWEEVHALLKELDI